MLLTTSEAWAEPTILDDDAAVPTAVVRHEHARSDDLPRLFDAAYPRVATALHAAGMSPSGPALALYRGDPAHTFSIEIGFPVSTPFTGGDGVLGSALPAGRVAVLSHFGSYEKLPEAWARMTGFLDGQGLRSGGHFGEIYVTEPSPATDPARLRTDIFVTLDR